LFKRKGKHKLILRIVHNSESKAEARDEPYQEVSYI
jgi:hypothetical protein